MKVAHPDVTQAGITRTLTQRLAGLRPSKHDLLDAAFLLALLAVALYAFTPTFDSAWIWLTISIGLLVGYGIAQLGRSLLWPLVILITLVAYFLLGGPLAVRDETWGFLPTPTSISSLGSMLVTGWKGMLTTLPPLDARGPYAALVLLIALFAATIGQLVARRTSRPSVALAVPIITFMGTIALGTLRPAWPLMQGLVFAALGFSWLANRFPRRRRFLGQQKVRKTTIALGAAMLVVGLVGGALLAGSLPFTSDKPRVVVRNYVQPPIDMRDYVSPLVGFRNYSSQGLQHYFDTPMLHVNSAPAGTVLRFAVLDAYNGYVWSATGDERDPSTGFLRLGSQIPNPPLTGTSDLTITVLQAYASNPDLNAWVPSLGRTAKLTFEGGAAKAHADSLRFNLSTSQALVPDRLRTGDVVHISAAPLAEFGSLPENTQPGKSALVAESTTSFLAGLSKTLAGDHLEAMARLKKAAAGLRGGAWSDGTKEGEAHFLPGHGQYRLAQFTTGFQFVGSDEQYAAVFALLATRYGFPARVALGATVPSDGTIKGQHVVAWVEIQIEDGSWVRVPTEVFTPDRSKQPSESPKEADDQASSLNVPPPNPARPPGSYGDMLDTDPASNKVLNQKKDQNQSWAWLVWYVAPPVGGLVLIVTLILGAKALRSRRRRTKGELWKRVAGGWRDLLDVAKDMGKHVPHKWTRLEQGKFLGGGKLDSLAAEANAAVFGGEHISEAQVGQYWMDLNDAKAGLLSQLPWWRRPIARLSLRSLLPGARNGRRQ